MHRFSWDLHYDAISGTRGGRGESVAVPHRTYPGPGSPWVAPGVYTVRLTVDGKVLSQPITVKLDPRVQVTSEVQQLFAVTAQAEDHARIAAKAYKDARAMIAKTTDGARIKKLEEIAPVEAPAAVDAGEFGGFGPPPPLPPATLANVASQLVGAVMPMQASEMAPTESQLAAFKTVESAYAALMTKWSGLRTASN